MKSLWIIFLLGAFAVDGGWGGFWNSPQRPHHKPRPPRHPPHGHPHRPHLPPPPNRANSPNNNQQGSHNLQAMASGTQNQIISPYTKQLPPPSHPHAHPPPHHNSNNHHRHHPHHPPQGGRHRPIPPPPHKHQHPHSHHHPHRPPPKSTSFFPPRNTYLKPASSNVHRQRVRPPPHHHLPVKSYRPPQNHGSNIFLNNNHEHGANGKEQNKNNFPQNKGHPSNGPHIPGYGPGPGTYTGPLQDFKQNEMPSSSLAPNHNSYSVDTTPKYKHMNDFGNTYSMSPITSNTIDTPYESLGLATSPNTNPLTNDITNDQEHGWTAPTYKGWRPIARPPTYYLERQKHEEELQQGLLPQPSQNYAMSYPPPPSSPVTHSPQSHSTTEKYRDVGGKHKQMMLNTLFRDNVKNIKPQVPVKIKEYEIIQSERAPQSQVLNADQGITIPLPDELGPGSSVRLPTDIFRDDFGTSGASGSFPVSFSEQTKPIRPYPHPDNHNHQSFPSGPPSGPGFGLASSHSEDAPVKKPFPKFKSRNESAAEAAKVNAAPAGFSNEAERPPPIPKFKSNRPKFQRPRTTTTSSPANKEENDQDELGPPKVTFSHQRPTPNFKEKINRHRGRRPQKRPDAYVSTEEVGQVLQSAPQTSGGPSFSSHKEKTQVMPSHNDDPTHPQNKPGPPYSEQPVEVVEFTRVANNTAGAPPPSPPQPSLFGGGFTGPMAPPPGFFDPVVLPPFPGSNPSAGSHPGPPSNVHPTTYRPERRPAYTRNPPEPSQSQENAVTPVKGIRAGPFKKKKVTKSTGTASNNRNQNSHNNNEHSFNNQNQGIQNNNDNLFNNQNLNNNNNNLFNHQNLNSDNSNAFKNQNLNSDENNNLLSQIPSGPPAGPTRHPRPSPPPAAASVSPFRHQEEQQPKLPHMNPIFNFENNNNNNGPPAFTSNNNGPPPFTGPFAPPEGFFYPAEFTGTSSETGNSAVSFVNMPGAHKPSIIRHPNDYPRHQPQSQTYQPQFTIESRPTQLHSNTHNFHMNGPKNPNNHGGPHGDHSHHHPPNPYPINILNSSPNFLSQFPTSNYPSNSGPPFQSSPPPFPQSSPNPFPLRAGPNNSPRPLGYTPLQSSHVPHRHPPHNFESTTPRNPTPFTPLSMMKEVLFGGSQNRYPTGPSSREVYQRQPTNSYKYPMIQPAPGPNPPHHHPHPGHPHQNPPPPMQGAKHRYPGGRPPTGPPPFRRPDGPTHKPPPNLPPASETLLGPIRTYPGSSMSITTSSSEHYERIPMEYMTQLKPILLDNHVGSQSTQKSTYIPSSTPMSSSSMGTSTLRSVHPPHTTQHSLTRHTHQSPMIHPPSNFFDDFLKPFQDSYSSTTERLPSTYPSRGEDESQNNVHVSHMHFYNSKPTHNSIMDGYPTPSTVPITAPRPRSPPPGHFDSHKSPSINFLQFLRPSSHHESAPPQLETTGSQTSVINVAKEPIYSVAPIHDFSILTTIAPIQEYDMFFTPKKPEMWSKLQPQSLENSVDYRYSPSSTSTESYFTPISPVEVRPTVLTPKIVKPTVLKAKDPGTIILPSTPYPNGGEIRATHRPVYKPLQPAGHHFQSHRSTTFKPSPSLSSSTASMESERTTKSSSEETNSVFTPESDSSQAGDSFKQQYSFSDPLPSYDPKVFVPPPASLEREPVEEMEPSNIPSSMSPSSVVPSSSTAPPQTEPETTTGNQELSSTTFSSKRYIRRRKPGYPGGGVGLGNRKRFFPRSNQTEKHHPAGPSSSSTQANNIPDDPLLHHINAKHQPNGSNHGNEPSIVETPAVTTHRPMRKFKPSPLLGAPASSQEESVTQSFVHPRKKLYFKRQKNPNFPPAGRLGLPARKHHVHDDHRRDGHGQVESAAPPLRGHGRGKESPEESSEPRHTTSAQLEDVKSGRESKSPLPITSPSGTNQRKNLLTSAESPDLINSDSGKSLATTPNSAVTYGESEWFQLKESSQAALHSSTERSGDEDRNKEREERKKVGSRSEERAIRRRVVTGFDRKHLKPKVVVRMSSSSSSSSSRPTKLPRQGLVADAEFSPRYRKYPALTYPKVMGLARSAESETSSSEPPTPSSSSPSSPSSAQVHEMLPTPSELKIQDSTSSESASSAPVDLQASSADTSTASAVSEESLSPLSSTRSQ